MVPAPKIEPSASSRASGTGPDYGIAGALGALSEEIAAPHPKPGESPLGEAVAGLIERSSAEPESQPSAPVPAAPGPAVLAAPVASERLYSVREVAVLLAVFAATTLLLGSESLLTWARRMEVGPVQQRWVSAAGALYRACDAVGLTQPRRLVVSAGNDLSRAFGTAEDPLFAEAWSRIDEIPFEGLSDELDASDWDEIEIEDPIPEEPPEPEPAAPPMPARQTVLLIGDSMMAGSLGAAISRTLGANPRFRVVRAAQVATGLSRPDLFDWMSVVGPLLEREKPQLVVCSLGANDGQRIFENDRALSFGTAAWNKAYRERVSAMMRKLAGSGARVLWLGLPPMRDERLSRRAAHLSRIFSASAKRARRVDYLELRMLVAGPDGGYTTFLRGPGGQMLRVRMEDGVHYSPAGSRLVARWVLDWVREKTRQPARAGRRP
jgi:hypothetical protein